LLSAIDCRDSDDDSVLLLLSPSGFVTGSGGSTLPVIKSVLKELTSRTRDAL
jgi:hypothetical protein